MIHTHVQAWDHASGNGTGYGTPNFSFSINNQLSATASQQPMAVAGTYRKLSVRLRTALTGSQTRTYVLMVNGSTTGLSVALNSSTQEATVTTDVAVSALDLVQLRVTNTNTPAANVAYVALDFEASSGSNVAIHGIGGAQADVVGSSTTNSPLYTPGSWDGETSVIATAGTVTAMAFNLSAAPGGGNTRTFAIEKNGTLQDGSGGTTDTRVVFNAADTLVGATFSLAVAAGDTIRIRHTPTGTPGNHRATGTLSLAATATNTWNLGFSNGAGPLAADGTTYQYLCGGRTLNSYTTTESDRVIQLPTGTSTFWLSGLRVVQQTAPGSGKSWVWTTRENSGDTSLAVTIADSNTTANNTGNSFECVAGDVLDMKAVAVSTPANAGITYFALIGSTNDQAPHEIAVPAGALALTGQAPTLVAVSTLTPGAGALAFTGRAPTLGLTTSGATIAVPAGGLVITPTPIGVAFEGPTTGTLTILGAAPALSLGVGGGSSSAIPRGTLTITGRTPSLLFLPGQPSPANLVFTGYAPTLRQPSTIIPVAAGTLVLVGQTPVLQGSQTIAVPAGTLTLLGLAPALTAQFVPVPAGTLALTGLAPSTAITAAVANCPALLLL